MRKMRKINGKRNTLIIVPEYEYEDVNNDCYGKLVRTK